MFVGSIKDLKEIEVIAPGVKNAFKKTLIGPEQGWDGWVMRLFTLKEDGMTPHHSHPWPHINYIISGRGTLNLDGKDTSLGEGSLAYVPSNTKHQFKNDAKENFVFICIVPEKGDV
jgi:quercetin dioxygenase-like cupin family protein